MPTNFELRTISADEVPHWSASVLIPFLESGNDDSLQHWARHLEPERAWVVSDGGRIVANCCIFSRDVTVPSTGGPCSTVAMTAVSGVGVHPSHRRRGLLTQMMGAMLADGAEKGEPVAGLLASEAGIYGRYGFGLASMNAEYILDPRRSRFVHAPQAAPVRLVGTDEARDLLPSLHDRARRCRPGDVNRNDATWADEWADPVHRRPGLSATFRAVTDGGFVAYRVKRHAEDRIEAHQVVIHDLYGVAPEIEARLWRFVFELDLVGEVVAWRRPPDDPLRWWLADPRQLRTKAVSDMLWVRPLDVPAALGARGYLGAGRLVLEVVGAPGLAGADPAAGRFVLDAGPDGVACRAASPRESTDVTLGVAALGSLLMGGVAASALAAARLVEVSRPRALALMDAMFLSRLAPFLGTGF